jgi:hypothetical protein
VSDPRPERRFDLALHRYLPKPEGREPPRDMLGPATFTDATTRTDPYWEQRWRDVPPGKLRWHDPLVRVEASDHGEAWQRAVDDQGCDIEVVHLGSDRRGDTYAARWWGPELRSYRRHRFVLPTNGTREKLVGDPFD